MPDFFEAALFACLFVAILTEMQLYGRKESQQENSHSHPVRRCEQHNKRTTSFLQQEVAIDLNLFSCRISRKMRLACSKLSSTTLPSGKGAQTRHSKEARGFAAEGICELQARKSNSLPFEKHALQTMCGQLLLYHFLAAASWTKSTKSPPAKLCA